VASFLQSLGNVATTVLSEALPLNYAPQSRDRNRTCGRRVIEVALVFTTGETLLFHTFDQIFPF